MHARTLCAHTHILFTVFLSLRRSFQLASRFSLFLSFICSLFFFSSKRRLREWSARADEKVRARTRERQRARERERCVRRRCLRLNGFLHRSGPRTNMIARKCCFETKPEAKKKIQNPKPLPNLILLPYFAPTLVCR